MRPAPSNWPRISTCLYYDDGSAAIDWLCHAFGFEVRLKVESDDGRVEHSELVFGEGLIMVGEPKPDILPNSRTPRQVGGGNTQSVMVYVDDVEAHCRRAEAAGAKITIPLKTSDYGEDYWTDRGYGCDDIGGHHWWFCQRLREPTRK
jgi:uncharacterized glyoxalase superfamily protein PhnB